MPAATVNLIDNWAIEQGGAWRVPMVWKSSAGTPVNLADYTARMQVRRAPQAQEALLELTTENGRIALGGTMGTITLQMTGEETAALAWRRGVYDLELIDTGGAIKRLIQGDIEVSPEVTK